MGDALSALEDFYFSLRDQVSMLSVATTPQEQRDTLNSQVVAARTAYWACVNKMFHDDDPQVISLTSQLKTATDQVKAAVKQMGSISKVIDDITEGVTIATQLAGLVVG